LAFGYDGRVRSDHDGAFTCGARFVGDGVRFGLRDAADVILGGFARQESFVNIGGADFKHESSVAQYFSAARRRRCEDQLHGRNVT